MEIIVGLIGITGLALACAFLAALFDDKWALRVAALLIARKEARVAYRARHAEVLAERVAEFGLPAMPWTEAKERG